jgi:glycosyltransferase involved in cell wall biosynthesis
VAFGRGSVLDRSFEESRVPIYELSTSRGFNVLAIASATFRLYGLLRRERFDIVQAHTSAGGLIARLAGWAARVPVVLWTVHGLGAHPGHPGLRRALIKRVEAFLDRLTDHYVVVSPHLLEEGVRNRAFPGSKVTVIPNGLKLDHGSMGPDAAAKKRELGIPEGCAIIGTVTRLEPQKAIDEFLHACAPVAAKFPDLVILIAGDGPLSLELKALAASLGLTRWVRFLGWRTDAVDLLGIMDVFCMTSRWEGCPMVLLEAMAVRRPVVATNIGGIREIVVHGQTGWLVEPRKPEAMADRIVSLLENVEERERMGRAARRRVEKDFSADAMLKAYTQLYRRLARNTARSHKALD